MIDDQAHRKPISYLSANDSNFMNHRPHSYNAGTRSMSHEKIYEAVNSVSRRFISQQKGSLYFYLEPPAHPKSYAPSQVATPGI